MKFLKEKKGIIISFIIGIILASSITVYAYSYFASDISYIKPGTQTAISVEKALNELYSKKENIDEYSNKPYTQTGLKVYDNRITIIDGGYYTDENGVTYVNITFKSNYASSELGQFLLLYGLPEINNSFNVVSENSTIPFLVSHDGGFGNNTSYYNRIESFNGATSLTQIKSGGTFTLKFKY